MRVQNVFVLGFAAMGVAVSGYGCSSGGGSGPSDAGSNADVQVIKDSGKDVVTPPDGNTTGCPTPEDVSGFAPTTPKAAKAPQDKCTTQQIDDYYTNCLDANAPSGACANWQKDTSNAACGTCLLSKQTDASWSALVLKTGIVSVNVTGCVALETNDNPPAQGGCPYKYQAAQDCEGAACDAICPVTDDPSFQLYQQCVQAAAAGGCKQYEDAVCDPEGQTWANCFNDQGGLGFEGLFKSVAPIFCSAGG